MERPMLHPSISAGGQLYNRFGGLSPEAILPTFISNRSSQIEISRIFLFFTSQIWDMKYF